MRPIVYTYDPKRLLNNHSPKWRRLVVDIFTQSQTVSLNNYLPLATNTELKSCLYLNSEII